MNLKVWEEETFEYLLNNGVFKVTDCGSLHSPVNSFEIKRNDKRELILTSYSDRDSQKKNIGLPDLPSGSIHSITGGFTLSDSKMTVEAKEVWGYETYSEPDPKTKAYIKKEISWVGTLEAIPDDNKKVFQLIEWVENLDISLYSWPHSLTEERETTITRVFSDDVGAKLEKSIKQKEYWSRSGCLILIIDGYELYIKPFKNKESKRPSGPGFILYKKFPSEDVRRKIRECLSFTFGLPIVYLGYTLLSEENKFIGFRAITPPIIDESIFSTFALPPAPIGGANTKRINSIVFSNMVNSLYTHYDTINFQQLSWDYWHAIFSPSHVKPILLGACIEALQTSYKKLKKPEYVTTLLSRPNAKYLRDEFLKIVNSMPLQEEEKKVLQDKAGNLNSPPQRILNERFFASLSLEMGEKEIGAWKRRNDAAHGTMRTKGGFTDLMKDTNLLKNILHRVIISMSNANSQYIDCYTPGYPIRQLRESTEAPVRFYFER